MSAIDKSGSGLSYLPGREDVSLVVIERKIQRLLLDLEELLVSEGLRIDHVEVDTRNFAKMETEIHIIRNMPT